jgi:hypothetical protein
MRVNYTPKILDRYLLECHIKNKIVYGYGLCPDIITDFFYKAYTLKKEFYSVNVHRYTDYFGSSFKYNHPFAHPVLVINDFDNLYKNINIGLQCSKKPHLINGFNLISDITFNRQDKPQYISKYFIIYNTELLNLSFIEWKEQEKINFFLENNKFYKNINKTINDAFNYPGIIKKK